jgi:hypothetical protein
MNVYLGGVTVHNSQIFIEQMDPKNG